jgi:hypothetical protein
MRVVGIMGRLARMVWGFLGALLALARVAGARLMSFAGVTVGFLGANGVFLLNWGAEWVWHAVQVTGFLMVVRNPRDPERPENDTGLPVVPLPHRASSMLGAGILATVTQWLLSHLLHGPAVGAAERWLGLSVEGVGSIDAGSLVMVVTWVWGGAVLLSELGWWTGYRIQWLLPLHPISDGLGELVFGKQGLGKNVRGLGWLFRWWAVLLAGLLLLYILRSGSLAWVYSWGIATIIAFAIAQGELRKRSP